jgi:hypothetical protein
VAADVNPGDNVELIGESGEKVVVVRQRKDSFNRVEITADGAILLGPGHLTPTPIGAGGGGPVISSDGSVTVTNPGGSYDLSVLPSGVFSAVTGAAIGGHRVVAFKADGTVEYADNTNTAHRYSSVAVTTQAASSGQPVNIVALGPVVEALWSWTPQELVFVGTNGLLTQTPPESPSFSRPIGVATSATSIFVSPHPTYLV